MNPFRVPVIFIIFSSGDAWGYHNLSRWDKNLTFSILLQLPQWCHFLLNTDLHRHLKDTIFTDFHELSIFKNPYEFVKFVSNKKKAHNIRNLDLGKAKTKILIY